MNERKGQVAVFVIVAILIVGMLAFLIFYKKNPVSPVGETFSPQSYLKTCVGEDLKTDIQTLANQGGYYNPEGYLDYNGDKIKYLCYASENSKTCVVQQPLIKEHFEEELGNKVKPKIESCFNDLKSEYEKRGYDASFGANKINTVINPTEISISINSQVEVKKGEINKNYGGFEIGIKSEIYSLLMTAISIIDYEATYGDSETTEYMQYYSDLKIEKIRLSEGSKVYRLNNVVTNETFTFASRSLVWPPGYGG